MLILYLIFFMHLKIIPGRSKVGSRRPDFLALTHNLKVIEKTYQYLDVIISQDKLIEIQHGSEA